MIPKVNNSEMKNEIVLYQSNELQERIEVRIEDETVWLNRQQLAILFGRDIKTIGKHINNVYSEGELQKNSTVANFATVQIEGGRNVERMIDFYNLDVIISVGYRVKSNQGVFFDGQVFDAYELASKIIRSAKKSIVLIDNYIDESTLTHLAKKNKQVKVLLMTKTINKQLALDAKKSK